MDGNIILLPLVATDEKVPSCPQELPHQTDGKSEPGPSGAGTVSVRAPLVASLPSELGWLTPFPLVSSERGHKERQSAEGGAGSGALRGPATAGPPADGAGEEPQQAFADSHGAAAAGGRAAGPQDYVQENVSEHPGRAQER